jgi:hypothetical protein
VYKVCVPDLVPEIIVPAVHHIPSPGASTAREKGSAGPAQERCDSGTLVNISLINVARASGRRAIKGTLRNGFILCYKNYYIR